MQLITKLCIAMAIAVSMLVSSSAVVAAPAPQSNAATSTATSTVSPKPLTISEKIEATAKKYGVQPSLMRSIISCESGFNPNAVNDRPGIEYSVGLSQINLLAHDITKEQASDPDFAIDFMARNLAQGHGDIWYTCYHQALR